MTAGEDVTLANAIHLAWPADSWRSCHVVVAVSGGADSVALLRTLAAIHDQSQGSGELIVAHFNHHMRGEHSDADAAWVAELASELGLACELGRAANSDELRSEESARSARYDFLLRVAGQRGARYVATAHTADDQAETVLMRVLRGSGIEGLAGIPFRRRLSDSITLVRPLLGVRRQQVEQYLDNIEQPYCEDASNAESVFTRNWIRNELMPQIRGRFQSDPDGALLRLARQASQWGELLESLALPLIEQAVKTERNRIEIDCAKLDEQPSIVITQVMRMAWREANWPEQAMGMKEWHRLAQALAEPQVSSFKLPANVRVERGPTFLVLAR